MDLFFIDPVCFFKTYFSFSVSDFLIIFFALIMISVFVFRIRFEKRLHRAVYEILLSVYLTTLICITLFNKNRIGLQSANLNPIINIQEIFGVNGVHQIRGDLSNMLLFLPFGVFGAIGFKTHKFRNCIISTFVVSFTIELLQFVLHRGCAETMDVICNVLGAVIGALITIRIIKTKDYFKDRYGV